MTGRSAAASCSREEWRGDYVIDGAEALERLVGYRRISGNLRISQTQLTDLDGLECLDAVGGDLYIARNALLADVAGLRGLSSIGGMLSLWNNAALANIEGLRGLDSVGGYLVVRDNGVLTSTDVLKHVQVGGTVQMGNNGLLPLLEAVGELASGISIPATAKASKAVVFEREYVRQKGATTEYEDSFSASPGAASLHIENGPGAASPITSATITLNGQELFGPSDFSGDVDSLEVEVALADENQLEVAIGGKPGSRLVVFIESEVAGQPEVSLAADPAIIYAGGASTLSWSAVDADSVSLDNGIGEVAASGSLAVAPPVTTTYTITASNPGGSVAASVTVTVEEVPSPEVTLSIAPAEIMMGESALLTWSSGNADVVSIDNGIGDVAASGSLTIEPAETTTYTITASGDGGTISASATLVVAPLPVATLEFTATPDSIAAGEIVQLSWESTNLLDLSIAPDLGSVDGSGTIDVAPAETTTYAISGTGPSGVMSREVTVTVSTGPGPDTEPQPEGSWGEQYNDLIPSDATVENYDPKRFSLLTGLVHDEAGAPIAGVQVTIHSHPEYGSATTDSQGRFSLPVEGGGVLTVVYEKAGLITSHRQIQSSWNDINIVKTVQLIPVDELSTTVVFDNPGTVTTHVASEISDERGTRAATLTFTGSNRAFVVDENGDDVAELSSIQVRATEYTKPETMPAKLPPNSAYTYCSEFQADGVERIRFSEPVVMWVDNFLGQEGLAVGSVVPIGYYDRDRAVWVPSNNGVVVRLLDSDSNGLVDALDATGNDEPDDLDGDGEFVDEVQGLQNADRFSAGDTFWRGETSHFTPFDLNLPYGLPRNAIRPNGGKPKDKREDEDCSCVSSVIMGKSRVFHEDIPIPGVGMLHYSSQRVSGYKTKVLVKASGATVPDSLASITVTLHIAGKEYEQVLAPAPNQTVEFKWDGNDHLGRKIKGSTRGRVHVAFGYQAVYKTAGPFQIAFGQAGEEELPFILPIEIPKVRQDEVVIPARATSEFGNGWTLSTHHEFQQPDNLLRGSGTEATAADRGVIQHEVALYDRRFFDLSIDAAGIAYTDQSATNLYGPLVIFPDGTKKNFFEHVGFDPLDLDIDRDFDGPWLVDDEGNAYSVHWNTNSLWRIGNDGSATMLVENLNDGAILSSSGADVEHMALDSVGNIYLAGYYRIRKLDPSGTLTTIAGNGTDGPFGADNVPAVNTPVDPERIACDSAGNLYFIERNVVRKIDTSGMITTVTGGGDVVDGHDIPAVENSFSYKPYGIALDPHGNLYIATTARVLVVRADGRIFHFAGDGSTYDWDPYVDDAPARSVTMDMYESPIAVGPTGNLYTRNDHHDHRLVSLEPAPIFEGDDTPYGSYVADGKRAYVFAIDGRHLATVDRDTRKTLTAFEYDDQERLARVVDRFDNAIVIERTEGIPTAIVSPHGHRTELIIDAEGDLRTIDFEDGTGYVFEYIDGLMTVKTDPKQNDWIHEFDEDGRLEISRDPELNAWTFDRVVEADGAIVSSVTSGEGNVKSQRETSDSGGMASITSYPGNAERVYTTSDDGMEQTLAACESETTSYTLDPESLQKVPAKVVTTTPELLTKTVEVSRSYERDAEEIVTSKSYCTAQNGRAPACVETDYQAGTIVSSTSMGRTTTTGFNTENLLVESVTVPGLEPASFFYYPNGKLERVEQGERILRYGYDDRGNLETVTDWKDRVVRYGYDLLGRVETIERKNQSILTLDYDDNGNLTVVDTPNAGDADIHNLDANGVNRLACYRTPEDRETWYHYDKERKLERVDLPSTKSIVNTYVDGLLKYVDTAEWQAEYTYTCGNKVDTIARGGEILDYGYDGSLLTSVVQHGTLEQTIGIGYDDDFNVASFAYAGVSESVGYDDDLMVTSVGRFTIERRTDNGLPETITADGFVDQRGFNGYGEQSSSAYTVQAQDAFSWDSTRNLDGQIDFKRETVSSAIVSEYDYDYDDVGRLRKVWLNSALVEEYRYDDNGNRTYEFNLRRGIEGREPSYSLDDQIVTVGDTAYSMDQDGRLAGVNDGVDPVIFTYSSSGELMNAAWTSGKRVDYVQDAIGRRVAKLVDDTVVEKYLWNGLTTLLAVYDGEGNLVQRFEYADDRVPYAMTAGASTYYLAYDQVGSLRVVVDASSGEIVKEIEYDSFGNILSDSNPGLIVPFGFAGGLHDRDTGLVGFGFRDYLPELGRWTAKDPLMFGAGDSNLYAYVGNAPVDFVDPDGLEIRIGAAPAFGIPGTNHVYAYDTNTGKGKGMEMGLSGGERGDGVPDHPSQYPSYPVDIGNQTPEEFMKRFMDYPGWNTGVYELGENDCHAELAEACKWAGGNCPAEVWPEGRVDWDDNIKAAAQAAAQAPGKAVSYGLKEGFRRLFGGFGL